MDSLILWCLEMWFLCWASLNLMNIYCTSLPSLSVGSTSGVSLPEIQESRPHLQVLSSNCLTSLSRLTSHWHGSPQLLLSWILFCKCLGKGARSLGILEECEIRMSPHFGITIYCLHERYKFYNYLKTTPMFCHPQKNEHCLRTMCLVQF
jgi:hypothetical protein